MYNYVLVCLHYQCFNYMEIQYRFLALLSAECELWLLRHGFGDCRKPLPETAALIEDIVYRQMVDIVSDHCNFEEM